MTSGPWTVNDVPSLTPVSSSASPSQYGSAGSFGRQTPTILIWTTRASPARLVRLSSSPTVRSSSPAAPVDTAASSGSAPDAGHEPSTSVA